MKLEEAIKIINSYDFNEIVEFENGEMQEAIDTVLSELEKQKTIKQEMRKVAYEEGYIQGFNKCREKIMYMEVE